MEKDRELLKRFIRLNAEMRKVIFNPEINAQFSIGRKQLSALTALSELGKINMSQLAKEVGVSNQQLTKIVDVLVSRELIERSYNPKNRRVVLVELTKAGKEYVQNLTETIIESVKQRGGPFDKKRIAELEDHLSYLEDFVSELNANR